MAVPTGGAVPLGPWRLRGPGVDVAAAVPGTVAGTVGPRPDLDRETWEWSTALPRLTGPYRLRFEGLATDCEVLLDGQVVARSVAMFTPSSVDLDDPAGQLTLRFLPLELPEGRKPRARWRSSLAADQGLRWRRTALFGRTTTTPQPPAPVGPWRPVVLHRRPALEVRSVATRLVGGDGVVRVDATGEGRVVVAGHEADVVDGVATVVVPRPPLWWPHTHGDQPLVDVAVEDADGPRLVGRTGFRDVRAETGDGGFRLVVNDRAVFARGACWTPLHPDTLQATPGELRAALEQARDAGMNLLRIAGNEVYEQPAFFDLCDELGLLVWQDAMLATFDYPDDDAWLAELDAELGAQLGSLAHHPSLAVVSGGSEIEQRAAMLGLPADRRVLGRAADLVARQGAALGLPTVSSTPSGSPVAHRVSVGTAHWFGVGAYRRPLSDVRTAGVRFAAECLAFAAPGDGDVSGPAPSDGGTDWTFDDVTDHYVRTLFGVDSGDDRWDDLRRAAVATCVERVFAEWRRPGSPCDGGIAIALRDVAPGRGWGLVDSAGHPKSGWWAFRRVCAPRAVTITDEGLDGLAVHVHNDPPADLEGVLRVETWSPQGTPVLDAERRVVVRGGSTSSYDLEEVLGSWRDVSWAWRFGPPTVDVVAATLTVDGEVLAQAVHLPLGDTRPRTDPGLRWEVEGDLVHVTTDGVARGIVISAPGWTADEQWFALAPGGRRTVRLAPDAPDAPPPVVEVRHLDRLPG